MGPIISLKGLREVALLCMILGQVFFTVSAVLAQEEGAEGASSGCEPSEDTPLLFKDCPIHLLQPLGDNQDDLEPEPGIKIFFTYFNASWPWIIGTTCGIAVLQAVVGGVQIMMSGSREKANEGKERIQWALVGLMMLALAGLILTTLNPLFYR